MTAKRNFSSGTGSPDTRKTDVRLARRTLTKDGPYSLARRILTKDGSYNNSQTIVLCVFKPKFLFYQKF